MIARPLIEGIHFIGAQGKPYIPWVRAEQRVVRIEVLQLTTIGWVCNHIVIDLALIVPPCHERSFLRVQEDTPQAVGHWQYHVTKAVIFLFFASLPNGVSSGG
jgi:hypothetical protein